MLLPCRLDRIEELPFVMKPLGECPLVYPSGLGVLESDRTGDDIFSVQSSIARSARLVG